VKERDARVTPEGRTHCRPAGNFARSPEGPRRGQGHPLRFARAVPRRALSGMPSPNRVSKARC